MADKFLMLVEGPDDYHVLQHLLTAHGVDKRIPYRLDGFRNPPKPSAEDEIVFRVLGGVQNVRKGMVEFLATQLKITGDLKRLGVVVDADADCAARWQSLRNVLVKSGYTDTPKQANPLGTILEHALEPDERPRVGIWIMPNNKDAGAMEHFFALLLTPDDTLWERARLCIEQIPAEDRLFKDAFIKAHVHTWLAWQETPGLPMGRAIAKPGKYLNANAPNALQLLDWLRRLFDLDSSP